MRRACPLIPLTSRRDAAVERRSCGAAEPPSHGQPRSRRDRRWRGSALVSGRGSGGERHAYRASRHQHGSAWDLLLAEQLRFEDPPVDGRLPRQRWNGLADDSPSAGDGRARGVHRARARFGQRRERVVGRAAIGRSDRGLSPRDELCARGDAGSWGPHRSCARARRRFLRRRKRGAVHRDSRKPVHRLRSVACGRSRTSAR